MNKQNVCSRVSNRFDDGNLHESRAVRRGAAKHLSGGFAPAGRALLMAVAAFTALAPSGGCDAFNPAFVNLIDPTGSSGLPTLGNAPGHLIISVVNNATVDERLFTFLKDRLDLTEAEEQALRPRIRMRVRVTFTDGTFQTIEFITGSPNLIDPAFDAQAFPDLNQNDLDNAVVVCDVASITIEPGTDIEVFIPVALEEYDRVTAVGVGGVLVETGFVFRQSIVPEFRSLSVDDVDPDGNVILPRNIGVRDAPSPVPSPLCGSVVTITISGVLAVPFLEGVTNVPAYSLDDQRAIARIGGRYEFRVAVQ